MALIVQKYGGTSVGDLSRIRNVARRVAKTRQEGNDVVVVVSAMSGETDRLIQLAYQASDNPDLREYDALISTGEQVSMALLAITLNAMGVPSKSFLAPQIRIITDNAFAKARIQRVEIKRLRKELKAGIIPIVAGFQGMDKNGNITTLGRGGSDTTGVALA
ncbi:MAG: aspartate kinase, partial [Deltaproteobacteria bacterium]|nr:aspartate kinase [Deltaproteobacteria bacterium]